MFTISILTSLPGFTYSYILCIKVGYNINNTGIFCRPEHNYYGSGNILQTKERDIVL